jgi:hypothetical protein
VAHTYGGRLKRGAYVVYNELSRGEVGTSSSVCNRVATGDPSMNRHAIGEWYKTTYKPVSKPPERGVHGWAKLDWVTEWFLGLNINSTASPTAAVWKRENVSANDQ